ncbi:hypothetical protein [Lutibacter sp. B1]|uniref:hypothetical protein n=1 Tax=Lutibacter sp. B1 TaxID=2725996 RepID=UPI0014576573|nr:hypothetical protein [Lutibacter sp. B1]NLP59404.1 hypothetical protein [Lutibacter sp. B1]
MNEKDFIKNEPAFLKVIYLIGIIFLLINLNDLTTENKETHLIFPILAFVILTTFFIRMILFNTKNDN